MNRLLPHIVILTIVVGSLCSMILDKELWPFSNYAMYSVVPRSPRRTMEIYGVLGSSAPGSAQQEVRFTNRFLTPLTSRRLDFFLGSDDHVDPIMLRKLLANYDRIRTSTPAYAEAPRFNKIRLYEDSWKIDGVSAFPLEDRMTHKLILEVSDAEAQP